MVRFLSKALTALIVAGIVRNHTKDVVAEGKKIARRLSGAPAPEAFN